MLAKLTCRGRDYPAAVARAKRALAEFRIRGVSTNISFLQAVLEDPAFVAGDLSTSFIDERPQLVRGRVSKDRGTKILNWLADVTVNQPNGPAPTSDQPGREAAGTSTCRRPAPDGSRQRLLELGPVGFAAALRAQTAARGHRDHLPRRPPVAARDARAHQGPRRGRAVRRPHDARSCSRSRPGAARPTTSRSGSSARIRGSGSPPSARPCPTSNIQMLLRGRNTVGYTPYPTEVTDAFIREAAATGVDIFRIFDALNDVDQMRPAIDAVLATGHAGRRGRPLLHGRPARPRRGPLHARLLPRPRRRDRRRRCPHPRDQGHGRPSPRRRPPSGSCPRSASASTCPCTCTPTTRRAGSWRRCSPRAAPASTRSTWRARRWPAPRASRPPPSLVAALAHTERDTGISLQAVRRPRAVLGGRAPHLQAVRVGPARPHRPRVPPRDPRRPALEPAPAGDRARPRRRVRAHRGHVRRGEPDPRPRAEGDAVVEGGRRPRPAPRRGQGRSGRLRGEPREVRHARLGDRLHGGRARRPAGRLAGAVPHEGARRQGRAHRRHRADRRAARRPSRPTPRPAEPR